MALNTHLKTKSTLVVPSKVGIFENHACPRGRQRRGSEDAISERVFGRIAFQKGKGILLSTFYYSKQATVLFMPSCGRINGNLLINVRRLLRCRQI